MRPPRLSVALALVVAGLVCATKARALTVTLQATLTVPGTQSGDAFGGAVAVSDGALLVGAPHQQGGWGGAYLFTRPDTAWVLAPAVQVGSNPRGSFGAALALSRDTALVGSPAAEDGQGAAYLYESTGAQLVLQTRLFPDLVTPGLRLGSAVALEDGTALVGAPGYASFAGTVFVLERSGVGWTSTAQFGPTDPRSTGQLGRAVALSGDTALVGALRGPAGGTAFVFRRGGDAWSEEVELLPDSSGGVPPTTYGEMLALDRDTAVLIAAGQDAVHVFRRGGTAWSTEATFRVSRTPWFFRLCGGVALAGDLLAVGGLEASQGFVYLYERSAGSWAQAARAEGTRVGEADSDTTFALAFAPGLLVVGVPGRGRVLVYSVLQGDGAACTVGAQCESGTCAAGVCCRGSCPCVDDGGAACASNAAAGLAARGCGCGAARRAGGAGVIAVLVTLALLLGSFRRRRRCSNPAAH
ncbi:MAG TPA: hypothetical protein VGQ83_42080 [Polyangia bacterium]|jgi:hypothetical protein